MQSTPRTTPPPSGALAPIRLALTSLDDRNFRLYWLTNALFFMGQGLVLMGAQWLMLSLTDSRTLLGLIGTIQGLSVLLFSPLGGVIADRLPRRNVLIAARLLSAGIMLGMVALILLGDVQVWHVLLSVGAAGIVLAFSQATTQTYVFDIVGRERLTNAIALNSLATALFQIVGPSIGGPLLATVGPKGTYFAGAIGFLIGAGVMLAIPILGKSAVRRAAGSFLKSTVSDAAEGFRYVSKDRTLIWLVSLSGMSFFAGAMFVLRPVFAKDVLHVGASGLGWMGTVFGLGALVSGLFMAGMGSRIKLLGLCAWYGQANWMLWQVVYSFSHWFGLTLFLEFLMGTSVSVGGAATISIIQQRVPPELRNRVLTVHFMLITATNINWIISGQLADKIGDRQALFAMGMVGVVFDLYVLIFVRRLILLGTKKYPIVERPLGSA